MRDQAYETGTFQHKGRSFYYALYVDQDLGPPWKEHDGHGPVRELRADCQNKHPGEWVLTVTRWGRWLYDFAEATKIAKRDGWGLGKDDEAELAQRLGREPTRKEIVREAVIRDFELMRGWLTDDWHWCWIKVWYADEDDFESIGGVESDADEHIENLKGELADQLADRLDDDLAAEIVEARPDMQPEFRP